MLKNEIKDNLNKRGFELNEMQITAEKMNGKNLIIKAPTGSGKTEAVLLALKDGVECNYFLPTVPSTDIMFKRLSTAYPTVQWSIRTSTMNEKTNLDEEKK